MKADDLLLLDAGAEVETRYVADVARPVPVSGGFTAVQRQVYELVYRAQEAAIAAVTDGAPFLEPHRAATRVFENELALWGLLPSRPDGSPRGGDALRRWMVTGGSSHLLGLDVHDCGEASLAAYRDGPVQIGMVLTVEPGLYFQEGDATVPYELRGLGVRIEDDVVVTDGAAKVLSSAIPREPSELEQWLNTTCSWIADS